MVMRLTAMQLQNTHLNEQLAKVQEEERAELARELHDEMDHFFSPSDWILPRYIDGKNKRRCFGSTRVPP